MRKLIERLGLTVYVDWIDDPNLNHGNVSPTTAAILRERMRACSSLIYAHAANSTRSIWMPWELGFFDGFNSSHVWIVPLVNNSDSEFANQEYLGLYPKIENLASLQEGQGLGFSKVGSNQTQVLLKDAVRGLGLHLA